MRIALVHNPDAGEAVYESRDLEHFFREAGYAVDLYGKRRHDVETAIASAPDVVAAAGGDGTVAKIAAALLERGQRIPIVILPIGTANNIARTLRVEGPVPALVRGLDAATSRRLDVGRATNSGSSDLFVEAVGVGFIGTMLRASTTRKEAVTRFVRGLLHPRHHWDATAVGVARLIARQPARHYTVRADGEDLSGEYIAVEVMNIREIGPRVALAPQADAGDGRLDLVLVPPSARESLADYVRGRAGPKHRPELISRRVQRAEIAWDEGDGHVDDEHVPAEQCHLEVEVCGAVDVLVPPQPAR